MNQIIHTGPISAFPVSHASTMHMHQRCTCDAMRHPRALRDCAEHKIPPPPLSLASSLFHSSLYFSFEVAAREIKPNLTINNKIELETRFLRYKICPLISFTCRPSVALKYDVELTRPPSSPDLPIVLCFMFCSFLY